MRPNHLTLREALASRRLNAFVRQEEARGVELARGSDLERALALLITMQRLRGSKPEKVAPGVSAYTWGHEC
jgi:hypothetical protein